ncbi:MAG: VCBS repeat-containing protein [Deltaproteobacteria bacterium]|nr:VCBS repeat-containing protein [Deltaproteobacteria bacterium]
MPTRLYLALLGLLVSIAPAFGQNKDWPPAESVTDLSQTSTWPADPGYANAWELFSFIPESALARVNAAEKALGSGMHADRAWQKTIGDPRVVIAVLDSGIRWETTDLVNKFYLNAGELPAPDAACRTAQFDAKNPHDANGDGVFNVQDYTKQSGIQQPRTPCDPRILGFTGGWDTNNNSLLDPQDLIAIFSDKKDDDNNGFVDDISGWDFFDNDNDASDDTFYGHGTGEAKDSAGEANNNIGNLGVCPTCRVMMVRVSDSFIADVNNFGLAAAFAVDSGAAVIQEALGSINNNSLARAAIDYAYQNNVTVIASAADENAFHANWPGANDHTIYVHAIVHDGQGVSTSTTFLNFNNCTNYGPRLDLSIPANACSSEAVGKTAGLAGLVYAAALKGNIPFPSGSAGPTDKFGSRRLSAEEVRQLMVMTVDDIDVPESLTDPKRYPARPGWDLRFGYGRPNARRLVDTIIDGKLPPEVDIRTPQWLQVIDTKSTKTVSIEGRLSFRKDRIENIDYVLEWAPGAAPLDKDFKVLSEKKGLTDPVDGKLFDWDVSTLKIDNPTMDAPDYDANRRMVTIRIRATGHSSKFGTLAARARKSFHVYADPDLLDGFPVDLGSSADASPTTADLNKDGKREIILTTSDGRVHVLDASGKPLAGWPQTLGTLRALDAAEDNNVLKSYAFNSGALDKQYSSSNTPLGQPAVGDIDADGELDIVAASHDGAVYAFAKDGTVKSGFPVRVPRLDLDKVTNRDDLIDEGVISTVALADLDGDKKLEIIVPAMDAKLYVWRADGSTQTGFPVELVDPTGNNEGKKRKTRIVSSPAIGDINGDGMLDIVIGSNETIGSSGPLHAVHGDGNAHAGGPFLEGWPVRVFSISSLPFIGEGLPNSPALVDVNGDGLPEIAISGVGTAPTLIRHTGEEKLPLCFNVDNPDLDKPDWGKHVVPCSRRITKTCAQEEAADPRVRCVDNTMNNTAYGSGSNAKDEPSIALITSSSIGDIDNDGVPDLVQPGGSVGAATAFAASGVRNDFEHHLGVWSTRSRRYLPGFPQRVDGWQFFMTAAIADIDGDDLPEVLVGSSGYWVHAFNKLGKEPAGWPKLIGHWVTATPAVGDLTGDGKLEVISVTRGGWLFVYKTQGSADGRIDWPTSGHDGFNSRNYDNPTDQGHRAVPISSDGGVNDGGVDGGTSPGGGGGGCCAVSGSGPETSVALTLLGLLLFLASRRRRSR